MPMRLKNIEEKSKPQRHFLDAKKITIICLALGVMIALVIVSFTTILNKFSFSTLISGIHDAFYDNQTKSMAIFMSTLLISYFFFKFFNVSVPYMIRLKSLGIKVPLKEAVLYYLTSAFLTAISPGILLTEPYNMFWLKTQGITTAQATAIVWINEFIYHTLLVFITLPAFIYLTTQFSSILAFDYRAGLVVIILASVGIGIDFLMFLFY
jgi:hypothetical protein